MNLRDIATLRLRNQRISGPRHDSPADAVGWLGAMQSQEYAVAKWSIGKRVRATTDAAIERAFAEGAILRTHVLRPTWHFVLPADIRWLLELTGPRVYAKNAAIERRLELDDRLFAKTRTLLVTALAGGTHLTRREVQALLLENGIVAEGQRLAYIMMRAELDCVICSGAPKGRQHTYALVDERAAHAKSLPRDEALAELTKRYLTSHGPATVKDFAWWSGLTLADVRRGLAMVSSQLERVEVADRTYWFADAASVRKPRSPMAHLMQGYDEYIVAYSESRAVLDIDGLALGGPRFRPPFTHAVIIDGQLVGHWRRAPSAQALIAEVQLGTRLDRAQKDAVAAAADRYRAFIGVERFDIRTAVKSGEK